MLFETAHLIAREIGPEDLDALAAVYGDPEAMRFVGDGTALPRERCVEWIAVTQRNYEARGYGMSALVLRATGEVVGFCGLVHPGGQEAAEIKYALRRDHWGQGLASEAVPAMLAWGAAKFGLREILATVAPGNAVSLRILHHVGMVRREPRVNEDGSQTEIFAWTGDPGPPAR